MFLLNITEVYENHSSLCLLSIDHDELVSVTILDWKELSIQAVFLTQRYCFERNGKIACHCSCLSSVQSQDSTSIGLLPVFNGVQLQTSKHM